MRRRTVLTLAAALLAGCSGDPDDGPTATRPTRSTTGAPPTSAPPPTATRSPAPTDSPTPTTARSTPTPTTETSTTPAYDIEPIPGASMTAEEVRERLSDRDCVPLAVLPVTCPGDDDRLRVSVSPTVGDLAEDSIEFTVENRGDETFMTNDYDWDLQKWDGDRWRPIGPREIPMPLDRILPGESHTYEISRADGDVANGWGAYMSEEEVSIGGLGPGVYGFTARGYYESSPEAERAVAAAFGFAGEGAAIRPTHDEVDVEREGSTLVIPAGVPDDDPADMPAGDLVVSFVDGDPDADLLAEHVRQPVALLNALPYAATGWADTVRYVGATYEARFAAEYLSFVTSEDATRYGFGDLTFEVTADL